MAIVYKTDQQGAFICGNTKTKITSYVLLTTPYATASKANPAKTAGAMLKNEEYWRKRVRSEAFHDYDARNWEYINA